MDASWSFNADVLKLLHPFMNGLDDFDWDFRISIGEFNAHTARHDFFLPRRNLTKTCPFAMRYLKIYVLAWSLHISYFLPFCWCRWCQFSFV